MDIAAQRHDAIYEKARLSRDARFDGQFFVGVRTTGIYCRPVCPANPPRSENVRFFPTAAAAGEAGYRPCLRCRPECAPGTPAWVGTSTTVQRALRLIAGGALDDDNIEGLATRLGVSGRHLRRLFTQHVGASPLAVAHTQRLQFAKRLIDQTALPMKDIALASGYRSVRRFNDTFRKTYGRSPRELRRHGARQDVAGELRVQVACRQPCDFASLFGFLADRAVRGIEYAEAARYLRSVEIDGTQGIIEVREKAGNLELRLHGIGTEALFSVVRRVRGLFDSDAPVADISRVLSRDPVLSPLLRQRSGIRVPGAWDGFELTLRAVLGQQVSVKAATTLAARLVERYGEPLDTRPDGLPGVSWRLFPRPEHLQRARVERLGIVRSRARTIRAVAAAAAAGELGFDAARHPDEIRSALLAIPGIGNWTAEYVAMRALKDPDAFPASDLGLLRAFDAQRDTRMSPAELQVLAQHWRPWRAYAALLLWGSAAGAGG